MDKRQNEGWQEGDKEFSRNIELEHKVTRGNVNLLLSPKNSDILGRCGIDLYIGWGSTLLIEILNNKVIAEVWMFETDDIWDECVSLLLLWPLMCKFTNVLNETCKSHYPAQGMAYGRGCMHSSYEWLSEWNFVDYIVWHCDYKQELGSQNTWVETIVLPCRGKTCSKLLKLVVPLFLYL